MDKQTIIKEEKITQSSALIETKIIKTYPENNLYLILFILDILILILGIWFFHVDGWFFVLLTIIALLLVIKIQSNKTIINLENKDDKELLQKKSEPKFWTYLIIFEIITTPIMIKLLMQNQKRELLDGIPQFLLLIFFHLIFIILAGITSNIENKLRINSDKNNLIIRKLIYILLTILYYIMVYFIINKVIH